MAAILSLCDYKRTEALLVYNAAAPMIAKGTTWRRPLTINRVL